MPRTSKKKIVTVVDIVASDHAQPKAIRTRRADEPVEAETFNRFSEMSDHESIFSASSSSKQKNDRREDPFQLSSSHRSKRRRRWPFLVGAMVVIVVVLYVALAVLPRVSIRIVAKKTPISFDGSITVNTRASQIDFESGAIPGEKITEKGSTVRSIVASGERHIEQKATGVITIINAHSTASQPLVATTRFETPEGKIFRLVKGITVPGAKMAGGSLEPSMIDAQVVADKVGEDYNIGPVSRFSIPGFKGTEKFNGFYGTSDSSMTGGFVGKGAVASPEDIERAKKDAQDELKEALAIKLSVDQQNLTLIPGAEEFLVRSVVVNPAVDADGTFKVTVEGELSAIKFREADIATLIKGRAVSDERIDSALEEKESSLSYQTPSFSSSSTIKIPLSYSATLWHPLNSDVVIENSLGKRELDLKKDILSLPGVDKMTVSFWPFWVSRVPDRAGAVSLSIE